MYDLSINLEQGTSILYWDRPGYEFVAGPDSGNNYILKDPQGEFIFASLGGISLPVLFYVDPKLAQDEDAKDVQQITLSYTFHKAEDSPS